MAPKKQDPTPPPPDPVVDLDPSAIAAREAQERRNAESRKNFERTELEARRRVEALESVAVKCVLWEKERRMNPAAQDANNKRNGGANDVIYIKLLTGNRAIPQQCYTLPFVPTQTMMEAKKQIYQRAAETGSTRALRNWFAPEYQTLILNGRELGTATEEPEAPTEPSGTPRGPKDAPPPPPPPPKPQDPNTLGMAALGVYPSAQIHLQLRTPAPSADMLPAKIRN